MEIRDCLLLNNLNGNWFKGCLDEYLTRADLCIIRMCCKNLKSLYPRKQNSDFTLEESLLLSGYFKAYEYLTKGEIPRHRYSYCKPFSTDDEIVQMKLVKNLDHPKEKRISFTSSSYHGNLKLLKHLFYESKNIHDQQACFDQQILYSAAEGGHKDIVIYLIEECSFKLDETTFSSAAISGNMELLKWLYENKCPWNEDACSSAAIQKDLEILKFLREKGCPWDRYTTGNALMNGNPIIAKWAKDNGCKFDSKWAKKCGYDYLCD